MLNIIQLENISKRFGGTIALDGVSFGIAEGEIHAVMGENGAGKSTLMRILSGVLSKDSGSVFLNGVEKNLASPLDAQREGISTVYQEPNLVPAMTVAENIFLGHEKIKKFGMVDFDYLNARTKEILAGLSLTIDPTEPLMRLRPAEIQMVQIARAIAFSTRILILDEPTASLTEHETEILFTLLKKLNNSGITIIYVSHRLKEIFDLCSRATVLRDGRFIKTVETAATNEKELISMMVGRTVEKTKGFDASRTTTQRKFEVKNLTLSHAPVRVNDVSFFINKGEIVALAGLVGSGRSEIAKAVFGLNKIDAGEIFLDGKRIAINAPHDAIRYGIALVPEDRKGEGLIMSQSLKHNISLTGLELISHAGFVNGASEAQLARNSSERLAIKSASIDAEISTLSGGNQQKAVLAKWLWRKPSVLLLDEPTRGIDVGAKAEIHNLMFELAQSGVAILLISSELPEVLNLADRIYVMRNGSVAGELHRANASQETIMHLAAIGN